MFHRPSIRVFCSFHFSGGGCGAEAIRVCVGASLRIGQASGQLARKSKHAVANQTGRMARALSRLSGEDDVKVKTNAGRRLL